MKLTRLAMAVIGAAALTAVSLQAHTKLEKSEPAANAVVSTPLKEVQVVFTEPPDPKISRLEIKGPSDAIKLVQLHVMDNAIRATVEGDAPDGAYTVSWQAAGKDGHIQKGDFSFTVKRQ